MIGTLYVPEEMLKQYLPSIPFIIRTTLYHPNFKPGEGEKGDEAMGKPKFEYYQGKDGKWRFRLKAANGEIVAVGEGYATEEGVKRGIEAVIRAALDAVVEKVSE